MLTPGTAWALLQPPYVDLGGERLNGDGLAFAGGLLYACDNSDEPDGSVRYWLTALPPPA